MKHTYILKYLYTIDEYCLEISKTKDLPGTLYSKNINNQD